MGGPDALARHLVHQKVAEAADQRLVLPSLGIGHRAIRYPWSARDPQDVAVLLHELVHHRQAGARHYYCPGAQEPLAYELQRDWLAERGLETRINWIAVRLEAGCTPRDIHPD